MKMYSSTWYVFMLRSYERVYFYYVDYQVQQKQSAVCPSSQLMFFFNFFTVVFVRESVVAGILVSYNTRYRYQYQE